MDKVPKTDLARRCEQGHPGCIEGLIVSARGKQVSLVGWWHFGWDQAWHITDPTGEKWPDVPVRDEDKGSPPNSLISAVPGLSFQPIVSAILKGHLYGDGQYDVPEGNASTSNVNTVLRVRVTDVEDISGLSD